MNNRDNNRLTMVRTTRDYLETNNSIWNSMTPLATAVTQLDAKLTEIDAAAQKQETPSGRTADKTAARDHLENVTFLMCQALYVLAHDANNNEVLALCDLNRSALDAMDEQTLATRAANVLATADAHKTELVALQVMQANHEEFTQALADFNEAKTGPREATATRRVQTELLRAKIQEAISLLENKIDRMVDLFSRTHPEFVDGYKNARMIVDRAATHRGGTPPADGTPTPP